MNEPDPFENFNATEIDVLWSTQDALSTFQIITFIWSLTCILPNAILIQILSKENPQQFYYTLLNWSACNIVLILSTIYQTVVPLKYVSFKVWEASYSFSMSLITLTVIFVTVFTYERVVKSKDHSKYLIYRFWAIVIILAAIAFISAFVEYIHIVFLIFSIGIINAICLLILLIKIILSIRRRSSPLDDETYSLRIILATIYVLVTFIERCFFICGYHWLLLFEILKIVIFADGFVNLSLLLYFDEIVKASFLKLYLRRTTEQ